MSAEKRMAAVGAHMGPRHQDLVLPSPPCMAAERARLRWEPGSFACVASCPCCTLPAAPAAACEHPTPDVTGWRSQRVGAVRMAPCAVASLPKTMKAARYYEFEGPIRVETVPVPVAPDGGVVVEVRATGVCRSDWHGWKGHDSDIEDHGLPFTPGHELSGVIAAIGEGVSRFTLGERVAVPFILSCGACRECDRSKPTVCEDQQQPGFTTNGSFAQYVALPRAERNIAHLPDSVSFAAAAALGCRFTTAYRAVIQQGQLDPSHVLAVFGCGGVGLSAIMIGVAHGATVIAVDMSEAARAKAEELGASASVDASLGDDHVRARVEELTGGVG